MNWTEALQGRQQMLQSQAYLNDWADYSGLQTNYFESQPSSLNLQYGGYLPSQSTVKNYINNAWAGTSISDWPVFNWDQAVGTSTTYYQIPAGTSGNFVTVDYESYGVPVAPIDRLREILRARRAPAITSRRVALVPLDTKELRARETLRLVVGETNYRSYLRHGHVTARNEASGRVYQIFAGLGLTKVYEKGQCVERLCVHLTHGFTATDNLIVRYLMCLNNEARLWQLANKRGVVSGAVTIITKPDLRPLPTIFAELKPESLWGDLQAA